MEKEQSECFEPVGEGKVEDSSFALEERKVGESIGSSTASDIEIVGADSETLSDSNRQEEECSNVVNNKTDANVEPQTPHSESVEEKVEITLALAQVPTELMNIPRPRLIYSIPQFGVCIFIGESI